jgi:hypothetical protein
MAVVVVAHLKPALEPAHRAAQVVVVKVVLEYTRVEM